MNALASRYKIATAIAILFHLVGLIGILVFQADGIIRTTALNLLLMLALVWYTDKNSPLKLFAFFALCFVAGFGAEWLGTSTGLLFGRYTYTKVLGFAWKDVPLIIGVNWFIIIYCCANFMRTLSTHLIQKLMDISGRLVKPTSQFSLILDGAILAVFFDWLMEPVAIELQYWQWLGDGAVPLLNYVCWFLLSVLLLLAYSAFRFSQANKFAVNLLLIQAMFFLLLRVFL